MKKFFAMLTIVALVVMTVMVVPVFAQGATPVTPVAPLVVPVVAQSAASASATATGFLSVLGQVGMLLVFLLLLGATQSVGVEAIKRVYNFIVSKIPPITKLQFSGKGTELLAYVVAGALAFSGQVSIGQVLPALQSGQFSQLDPLITTAVLGLVSTAIHDYVKKNQLPTS